MLKEKEDPTLQKIIKWVAKNPGINLYYIDETSKKLEGVNRTTAMRKIKEQYRLVDNGFLRMEKRKRKAQEYWFTFKGLIYALDIGAIMEKEAAEIRQNHHIRMPKYYDYPDFGVPKFRTTETRDVEKLLKQSRLVRFRSKINRATEKYVEEFQRFLGYQGFETKLVKKVECLYSALIYSEMVSKVNLEHYDEKWVGFLYYWLLKRAHIDFTTKYPNDEEILKFVLTCLKEDKPSQELIRKVFLPYQIAFTEAMMSTDLYPKGKLRQMIKILKRLKKRFPRTLTNELSRLSNMSTAPKD